MMTIFHMNTVKLKVRH